VWPHTSGLHLSSQPLSPSHLKSFSTFNVHDGFEAHDTNVVVDVDVVRAVVSLSNVGMAAPEEVSVEVVLVVVTDVGNTWAKENPAWQAQSGNPAEPGGQGKQPFFGQAGSGDTDAGHPPPTI